MFLYPMFLLMESAISEKLLNAAAKQICGVLYNVCTIAVKIYLIVINSSLTADLPGRRLIWIVSVSFFSPGRITFKS